MNDTDQQTQDLSPRQVNLLKCIINEYTKTGEPVASEVIDKKYHLGVSPATIRNEMVELADTGFLMKEHSSSGRVPTAKAFRFYIQNLMSEKALTTAEEVSVKNDVWDYRKELHSLLQHATQNLAKRSKMLAVATTNKGDLYYFGVGNLLCQPEFFGVEENMDLFSKFEEFSFWQSLLDKFRVLEEEILFMFAEESQEKSYFVSVFGDFNSQDIHGSIGVIGPRRMQYEVIVPQIRYFTNLIEDIITQNHN